MPALAWLLNLDFAGSPAGVATLATFLVASVRIEPALQFVAHVEPALEMSTHVEPALEASPSVNG